MASVDFKTVLLEFFDTTQSGLAEPITYLWNRQILDSISDVSGTGVLRLLASDEQKGSESPTLIQTPFANHDLAVTIAKQYGGQVVLWGTIARDSTSVIVVPAITLSGTGNTNWLDAPSTARAKELGALPPEIGLSRLTFRPSKLSLSKMYGRSARVRCARDNKCPEGTIKLLREPLESSDGEDLQVGDRLELDLANQRPTGNFVPVQTAAGDRGWIYTYYLDFIPDRVYVSVRNKTRLQKAPNQRSSADPLIAGPVALDCSDAILVGSEDQQTRWFLVTTTEGVGWIPQGPARPLRESAHVHFVAGLTRYARGRFESAHDELEAFVASSVEQDNVARSVAYKLMASSLLASKALPPERDVDLAVGYVDRAAQLTPYDPRARYLRAFANSFWLPPAATQLKSTQIRQDLRLAKKYASKREEEGEVFTLSVTAVERATEN